MRSHPSAVTLKKDTILPQVRPFDTVALQLPLTPGFASESLYKAQWLGYLSSSQNITLSQTKIQDVTPLIFYICRALPHPRIVSYYSRPLVRETWTGFGALVASGQGRGKATLYTTGKVGVLLYGELQGAKTPLWGRMQRVYVYIFGLRTPFEVYLNLWGVHTPQLLQTAFSSEKLRKANF